MHVIEVLLGVSCFVFILSLVPFALMDKSKLLNLLGTIAIVSLIIIAICLFLYVCNALMTCITIWFGNW